MGSKVAVARPDGPEGSAKIRLRFMPASERYAFAEFTLDATERRLSRVGRPISLEPKTHDVLVALVRHAGRLVTKRDPGSGLAESFVGDGILTLHISNLRKALEEGAHGARHRNRSPVGIPLRQCGHQTGAQSRRRLGTLLAGGAACAASHHRDSVGT